MKKYTLKYFRDMVRLGLATDISNYYFQDVIRIARYADKVGYSTGKYGINGGMLQDPRSGEIYVIIGRGSNLFRVF